MLDAAQRPGRFDRRVFVPPPDKEARRRILELLLEPVPRQKVDVGRLAADLELCSGGDLRAVVETAVDEVIDGPWTAGTRRAQAPRVRVTGARGTPSNRSGWHRESPDPELWRSP